MYFLDQDLYKMTMGQAIAVKYPRAEARYELIVRSPVRWPASVRDLRRGGGAVDVTVAALRWVDRNVGHGDLNAAVLARGVVALIDEAGDLALFPARGAQQGRRVSDPAVATLRLGACGDEVRGWRGGEVVRVQTRP